MTKHIHNVEYMEICINDDGEIKAIDTGCGCCSDIYTLSKASAIRAVDEEMTKLKTLKAQLRKLKEVKA